MHNIAVDAVVIPAGGHGDEKPVRPFNHFNVVQGDCIVQRDGYDCAQSAVMQQSADLYIGNVYHKICSVSPTSFCQRALCASVCLRAILV